MIVDKRHSSVIQSNATDHRLVIASLYDGRGESGIAPTPGGAAGAPNTGAMAESTDHRPPTQHPDEPGQQRQRGAQGNAPNFQRCQ